MYAIETDRAQNLIRVRLAGMLSVDEVDRYMTELRTRFTRERFRAGFRIMIDVTECPIQTQDMVAAMGRRMADFPRAGRIAMVAASQLSRLQIRRVMTQSYASVFGTAADALVWLAEEPAAPTDAPSVPA